MEILWATVGGRGAYLRLLWMAGDCCYGAPGRCAPCVFSPSILMYMNIYSIER